MMYEGYTGKIFCVNIWLEEISGVVFSTMCSWVLSEPKSISLGLNVTAHFDDDSNKYPKGIWESSWVVERCSMGLEPIISNHWREESWEKVDWMHLTFLPPAKLECCCTSALMLSSLKVYWTVCHSLLWSRFQMLKSCVSQITVKGLGPHEDGNQIPLCFSAKDIGVFRQLLSIFMIFGEFARTWSIAERLLDINVVATELQSSLSMGWGTRIGRNMRYLCILLVCWKVTDGEWRGVGGGRVGERQHMALADGQECRKKASAKSWRAVH